VDSLECGELRAVVRGGAPLRTKEAANWAASLTVPVAYCFRRRGTASLTRTGSFGIVMAATPKPIAVAKLTTRNKISISGAPFLSAM
jgi:hypothetical protein